MNPNSFFIIQEEVTDGPVAETIWIWTTNNTKMLIDDYTEYKPKLGTQEIKNMKQLWELIAEKMNGPTPAQCENKWRALERAYKKHLDNQNKTGQGRRFFEFLDEMDNIFKGKKNVAPVILLSSSTLDTPVAEEMSVSEDNAENVFNPSASSSSRQTRRILKTNKLSRRSNNPILNRNIILDNIRKDKKEYFNERLEIERQKVNLLEERNILLREKNELLKNKCQNCIQKLN